MPFTGSGTDAAAGAKAIKDAGGRMTAQNPAEAEFDGKPRGAISAGIVDLVLPTGKMPVALVGCESHRYVRTEGFGTRLTSDGSLLKIIYFLREKTPMSSGVMRTNVQNRDCYFALLVQTTLKSNAPPAIWSST
jgi:CheB methylesterase